MAFKFLCKDKDLLSISSLLVLFYLLLTCTLIAPCMLRIQEETLVPVEGMPFYLVANAAKGLFAYGLVSLIKDVFDDLIIWYSFDG